MTSFRQFEANRRNAVRSTGPKTEHGKQQSRRNAVRHGLTAETVISSLEDAEDYKAFEAAIIADYDATTAVERELVLRLASLLWRLRRATGIETDLLTIQAEILRDGRLASPELAHATPGAFHCAAAPDTECDPGHAASAGQQGHLSGDVTEVRTGTTRRLTFCFLRLTNLDNGVLERLSRYEAALWRQTVQTLFALQSARFR
jgi:hypothetical protein